MTNLDKAREIVGGNWVVFNKEYSAAMQMAQWKDQQFKEYLEKKSISVLNRYIREVYDHDAKSFGLDLIDEIINELFPATEQKKED